jgi:hypothetical protein
VKDFPPPAFHAKDPIERGKVCELDQLALVTAELADHVRLERQIIGRLEEPIAAPRATRNESGFVHCHPYSCDQSRAGTLSVAVRACL